MKTKSHVTTVTKRQMRSVPAEIESALRKEAQRLGCNPNAIMRYLLKRAIREFTPLPEDMILP